MPACLPSAADGPDWERITQLCHIWPPFRANLLELCHIGASPFVPNSFANYVTNTFPRPSSPPPTQAGGGGNAMEDEEIKREGNRFFVMRYGTKKFVNPGSVEEIEDRSKQLFEE